MKAILSLQTHPIYLQSENFKVVSFQIKYTICTSIVLTQFCRFEIQFMNVHTTAMEISIVYVLISIISMYDNRVETDSEL